MKNLLLILTLGLLLSACASKDKEAYPCYETATADDSRLDILVIGDSISIGYTPYVQDALATNYDVSHNLCNAMESSNGVKKIDLWLSQRATWEAITFNHGLWDAASWVNTPISTYKNNLHVIAQKIKARTSKPLFILTTEVLPGTPYRNDSRVQALNAAAVEVMNAEGIPVLDLHTFSQTIQDKHVNPNDVHYTEEGSSLLADEVLNELNTLYGIN